MHKILPAPHPILVEIEITDELISALHKMRVSEPLSNAEQFEIARLIFITARAFCLNKRADHRGL